LPPLLRDRRRNAAPSTGLTVWKVHSSSGVGSYCSRLNNHAEIEIFDATSRTTP
jgi:hypothetical protein